LKAVALDLVREVLDHELVDVHGVPCGMADDVELSGAPGEALYVVALWCGPGVAQTRLPAWMARWTQRIFGKRKTRIEWRHVARIGEHIELDCSAADLKLDRAERRWRQWISKLPGA
jgi:hypothetical protein